jgi:uncharacterized membrane protein
MPLNKNSYHIMAPTLGKFILIYRMYISIVSHLRIQHQSVGVVALFGCYVEQVFGVSFLFELKQGK